MALEALSTTPCNNDPFNFIFYDATLSAGAGAGNNGFFSENACPEIQDLTAGGVGGGLNGGCSAVEPGRSGNLVGEGSQGGGGAGGRKKRRRRQKYTCSSPPLIPNKCTSKTSAAAADIEVTLIETHANVRILSPRRKARQLSKMVAAFQTIMCMSVLHLNVTTFDLLVLYSISAKVEGGCQLSSADEIAEAVHHILRGIEEEELTIP
nr:transcription factor bHLH71-like [Ipomoea batatas]